MENFDFVFFVKSSFLFYFDLCTTKKALRKRQKELSAETTFALLQENLHPFSQVQEKMNIVLSLIQHKLTKLHAHGLVRNVL